ncbi:MULTISPECIES: hypothetical protein [Protofrankia]|uniref:Uncharacterized protein n=1 Tax=Candidatus Protofrankia datiscae TaxID=2716812 RepID=F8AZZ6_9ACTN|nr:MULTISPECIES: hypothetical protein [Protofrankia]AEH10643.1 hypothetical protein FsymDg_3339 [Candidatus Protofrankia datiscae]
MLRPTPGELLEGLRRELRDEVLPAVPAGSAARQLRAAIHVLGRLADTWDAQHHYLETDNVDLEATLASLARLAGVQRTRQPPRPRPVPGVTDRGLSDLIARNESLQKELELLQSQHRAAGHEDEDLGRVLFELHRRRTNRAAAAAGVAHDR